ncbi:hypothetical protein [Paracoccus siganidrum]|uniref:hypothetical protein n=1 Tax=Paracoccus siganidrum TaxID=1276757 RepID=UPI0014740323|nr:hypothetical protein [Paracoccus siganidrum]
MADKESKGSEKTLEMRVAELEDKLQGMQVTEEEMRAYNKVSAMMAGAQPAASPAAINDPAMIPAPDACIISQCVRPCTVVQQCVIHPCVVSQCIRPCTVVQQCIRPCTVIQQCISACINECGGGCAPGGGGFGGGGFGNLGG